MSEQEQPQAGGEDNLEHIRNHKGQGSSGQNPEQANSCAGREASGKCAPNANEPEAERSNPNPPQPAEDSEWDELGLADLWTDFVDDNDGLGKFFSAIASNHNAALNRAVEPHLLGVTEQKLANANAKLQKEVQELREQSKPFGFHEREQMAALSKNFKELLEHNQSLTARLEAAEKNEQIYRNYLRECHNDIWMGMFDAEYGTAARASQSSEGAK